jgi:hypothetical protein
MGVCTDRATTYLKREGYNVVRHPQAGIEPLQLIGRQGNAVALLGGLDRLIASPLGSLPEPHRDQRAGDLNGRVSSKLPLAIGLNVLANFIGAMGGNLGIKVQYEQAQRIEFQFSDVLTDSVMPLNVGNYLRAGEVDAGNLVLEQYVLGNGQLYLITTTVKAREFKVKAERRDGTEVGLDVPAIREVVGANISVSAESDRASVITYKGPEYLVFDASKPFWSA